VKQLKTTKQKEAILSAVRAMHNHPTADEIYSRLRIEHPQISLGTVYRNLNNFAQEGEILKIPIMGGKDRFDFKTDAHEHMLCDNCNKVFDVEVDVEIKLAETGANDPRLNGYTLVLHGLCPDCSSAKDLSL